MKNLFLSIVLVAGAFLAGCGSSTSGGGSATCEVNKGMAGHACESVSINAGAAPMCPAGTTSVSSCDSANQLGTCTYSVSAGGVSETISAVYYSDGGFTAASAQQGCEALSGAKWTAK